MTGVETKKEMIKQMGAEQLRNYLKYQPQDLQYIDHPSESLLLALLKFDGKNIQFIKNPSEKLKERAIYQTLDAVPFIKNPSAGLRQAIKNCQVRKKINAEETYQSPKLDLLTPALNDMRHDDNPTNAPYEVNFICPAGFQEPEDHITPEDGLELAKVLESYRRLAALKLDHNDIGKLSAEAIKAALVNSMSSNLVYVDIAHDPAKNRPQPIDTELHSICAENKKTALELIKKIRAGADKLTEDDINGTEESADTEERAGIERCIPAIVCVAQRELHMALPDIAKMLMSVKKRADELEAYFVVPGYVLKKPVLGAHTQAVEQETGAIREL